MDLVWQHQQVRSEIEAGMAEVMRRGAFILGEEGIRFERNYASHLGLPFCAGVASGTDALELALRAAGVGPEDEVLVPANTFIATVEAVLRCGARPRLVDCDDEYLLLDPKGLERARTPRTRAVVPVHLFGQMAPMNDILNFASAYDLRVVEDASQCHGSTQDGIGPGSRTTGATTSFYPGKNLGAYGDAGAVVTRHPWLDERVRLLRDHGRSGKHEHQLVGCNSRLDELQAVVLNCKLPHLMDWNRHRATAAARYEQLMDGLQSLRLPRTLAGNAHVWHLYVVRVAKRADVVRRMEACGIETGSHYPIPLHLQPAMKQLGYKVGDFPIAERAAREILSLPLFPGITPKQQERVVEVLRKANSPSGAGC